MISGALEETCGQVQMGSQSEESSSLAGSLLQWKCARSSLLHCTLARDCVSRALQSTAYSIQSTVYSLQSAGVFCWGKK